MVKMMNVFVAVMTLWLMLSTFSTSQTDEITCDEAIPLFKPCKEYLVGSAEISPQCCEGANTVYKRASTTQNRRELCSCLKNAASKYGVKPDKAKQLPKLCKIDLPVPVDPSIDCNSVA
ncbi:non-specific lipid-transfer protein 1-like [Abrus precatorius]|uniref:Non-specific lipid-transfer protein n=1 Tax=Abrus precatorius TaxID=3816 RepID=A0A8B8KQ77_ABRPR|nr:non-specific lipid-transfer protein 1-like [Abrus precatorius]XP_027345468.1 non-specific lipid-transfer protein 1-like [Abrus precatorius]